MNDKTHKIQALIILWIKKKREPVRHERLRGICHECVFAVMKKKEEHILYKYFYPLVRAGIVECGQNDGKVVWQLAAPAVFYSDSEKKRTWIGINLSETQKDLINAENVIENECDETNELLNAVCRWETSLEEKGIELPIVENPTALSLLKLFPICTPTTLAEYEPGIDISRYKFKYNSSKNNHWHNIENIMRTPGLYRLGEEVYSSRAYYSEGKTYRIASMDRNPNNNYWALARTWIDEDKALAVYFPKEEKITFRIDLPFLLARVLLINQMFDRFTINSKTYFNVKTKHIYELQRIFCNKIELSGDN